MYGDGRETDDLELHLASDDMDTLLSEGADTRDPKPFERVLENYRENPGHLNTHDLVRTKEIRLHVAIEHPDLKEEADEVYERIQENVPDPEGILDRVRRACARLTYAGWRSPHSPVYATTGGTNPLDEPLI